MEYGDCAGPTSGKDVQRRLVVVGTGIQWASQTTLAAQRAMQLADRVLFAVADPWAARWIREISPNAEALDYPRNGRSRRSIYKTMVDRIIAELSTNARVCAVFYGCPAVLTQPAHDAVRRARECGYEAFMLPGVSFLECLFVDLAIDPGREGCQVVEGSNFLLGGRVPDIHSHLVLCQIGMIGNRMAFEPSAQPLIRGTLGLLQRRLMRHYPPEHPLVIYEAARQPGEHPRMERLRLDQLCGAWVSGISTLYVPPACPAVLDEEVLAELSELQRAWIASQPANGSRPAASSQESS
jgi:uncharacterized protein YabN with tetrapyrrole methylase and pyrophosphatase domain